MKSNSAPPPDRATTNSCMYSRGNVGYIWNISGQSNTIEWEANMDLYRYAEKAMKMDDATWERHANPWSVWTRLLTTMPLASAALWSRTLLGWYSLIPIAIAVFWAWLNPRAFPAPRTTDNWASKGVFGEKIFLERRNSDVPSHHIAAARMLAMLGIACLLVWLFGVYALHGWATITGAAGVVVSKAWFVDRMVWVYEDMHVANPSDTSQG